MSALILVLMLSTPSPKQNVIDEWKSHSDQLQANANDFCRTLLDTAYGYVVSRPDLSVDINDKGTGRISLVLTLGPEQFVILRYQYIEGKYQGVVHRIPKKPVLIWEDKDRFVLGGKDCSYSFVFDNPFSVEREW